MQDNNQFNEFENGDYEPNQIPPISRGQKIAVAVLAVFALTTIGMWFANFKKTFAEPFAQTDESATSSQETDIEIQNLIAMQSKDTDNDGLSDYDETYVYKTSVYLEDTDSDGISDKQEVEKGTNPTCPSGQDCSQDLYNSTAQNTSSSTVNTQALKNLQAIDEVSEVVTNIQESTIASQNQGIGTSTNTSQINNILQGQTDAKTLRQSLLSAGMDKAVLDKISDADLMKTYQEVLQK